MEGRAEHVGRGEAPVCAGRLLLGGRVGVACVLLRPSRTEELPSSDPHHRYRFPSDLIAL